MYKSYITNKYILCKKRMKEEFTAQGVKFLRHIFLCENLLEEWRIRLPY